MQKVRSHLIRLNSIGRTALLGVLAALAVLQAGCSYPKPVRTCELVIQYDRMTDCFDPLVSLVYMPQEGSLSAYGNFIIGEVEAGQYWLEDPQMAARYATFFRNVLRNELVRTRRFASVTLDPQASFGAPALILEGTISRLDAGSGPLRYLSGLFFFLQSVAATDFQIEGRIVDRESGDLIVEFVDRRRHLGNTRWGPNPRTLDDDFAMKQTVKETAQCLARFIARAHAGLPPD